MTETRADGGGNMRPRLLSRSMEFRAILSSAHTTRRAVRPVTCVARRGALATAKAALAERRQAIVRRNAVPFVPQARYTSNFFLMRERDVRVRQWQAPPARRSKAHLKYFFGETKTFTSIPEKSDYKHDARSHDGGGIRRAPRGLARPLPLRPRVRLHGV